MTSTAIRLRRVALRERWRIWAGGIMPGIGTSATETVARVHYKIAKQHGTPITTLSVA